MWYSPPVFGTAERGPFLPVPWSWSRVAHQLAGALCRRHKALPPPHSPALCPSLQCVNGGHQVWGWEGCCCLSPCLLPAPATKVNAQVMAGHCGGPDLGHLQPRPCPFLWAVYAAPRVTGWAGQWFAPGAAPSSSGSLSLEGGAPAPERDRPCTHCVRPLHRERLREARPCGPSGQPRPLCVRPPPPPWRWGLCCHLCWGWAAPLGAVVDVRSCSSLNSDPAGVGAQVVYPGRVGCGCGAGLAGPAAWGP